MSDAEAIEFIRQVIAGSIALSSQEQKALSSDPNPEWFCKYGSVTIKMHTDARRERISGVKLVAVGDERSFFNIGGVRAQNNGAVGPRKAVDENRNCFQAWTAGLTWDEARQFLAKILANSLATTPNLNRS